MEENNIVDDNMQVEYSGFDKFFGISKSGSSIKTEIIAGIVTFLAMAYILTLNPTILVGPGSNLWSSVFIATAISAVVGTLLMALFARMPFAQAPGLGLNSMVSLLVGGTLVSGVKYSYANAMILVFISGLIFIALSLIPYKRDSETGKLVSIREAIFDGMPKQLRTAISVGIGLFITIVGLANAKVVQTGAGTVVDLVAFNNPDNWANGGAAASACVCLFGVFVIALLSHFKVKGSVIIGIIAATILAIPLKVADLSVIAGNGSTSWAFWENFTKFFSFKESEGGAFFVLFTEGFNFPQNALFGSIVVVITFCMIDMFDTMGTVIGCCTSVGLLDENGKPISYDKIMLSDSIATCAGAVLGTSTVTTFVESGSGIAAGGRTGLTALTVAVLFFLSIFLSPLFEFIPTSACASALVYVGVLMLSNVKNIDFTDTKSIVPAFLTIVVMPFGYSITDGIGFGVISYVIIAFIIYVVDLIRYNTHNIDEKPKLDISVVLLVVCILFLVYFCVPTSF